MALFFSGMFTGMAYMLALVMLNDGRLW